MSRTNRLRIRTPEGILFTLQIAGPLARLLAWVIDVGFMLLLVNLALSLFSILQIFSFAISQALAILIYFIFQTGYMMFFEWFWRGQTLGKRVLRLRVMDRQGLRLRFSQVVLRNLVRAIDVLPAMYLVGGITCLFTRHSQRLGDLAANTLVVRYPKISEPDCENILTGKFNSFRNYPHLTARLRQRINPQEADLALRALLRRDSLDDNARIELFATIADHFRNTVLLPAEATDGLSDEQYTRNVVELLYRP